MNYDKYQFVLEWDELPEDFREEKITEYIEKDFMVYGIKKLFNIQLQDPQCACVIMG